MSKCQLEQVLLICMLFYNININIKRSLTKVVRTWPPKGKADCDFNNDKGKENKSKEWSTNIQIS